VILLDTDHVNVLKYPSHPAFEALTTRLNASDDQDITTTVITIEEQMRGWLAWINRADDLQRQVLGYQELQRLFEFYAHWRVTPFDDQAAAAFEALRQRRIRIGTMDSRLRRLLWFTMRCCCLQTCETFSASQIFASPIGSMKTLKALRPPGQSDWLNSPAPLSVKDRAG
jgi:tRNA(fMet)-specific endonuclease VapC